MSWPEAVTAVVAMICIVILGLGIPVVVDRSMERFNRKERGE
jgi:hypothetical protein